MEERAHAMRAGVMRMNKGRASSLAPESAEADGTGLEPCLFDLFEQGRTSGREEGLRNAQPPQLLHQLKNLPLASAHPASHIEMNGVNGASHAGSCCALWRI
jgi:hypothetical protein